MPTHPSSRALVLGVVLPYLLLVVVKLGLSHGLDTPLKVDELGYLGNARYLATGAGLVDATGRSSYKVGYSLFLVPAFWNERGPVEGFKAAQVINAFLLSLVFPLAFLLAGRVRRDLAVLDRSLIAGCVSLYPAALLYATTAMSANLFIPCFFAYALSAHEALRRPTAVGPWMAWGATAGLLYMIHERAIGAVAVAMLTAGAVAAWRARRHGIRAAMPLILWPILQSTIGYLNRVAPPGATWKTGGKSAEFLWGAIEQPLKLWTTFVGQSWYLLLGTGGVLAIAGLYRLLAARAEPSQAEPARAEATDPFESNRGEADAPTTLGRSAFVWVMLAASSSVFALSVLFMAQRANTRFSHWVYGRYNDGVLLPVLLLALVALWRPDRRVNRGRLLKASLGAATLLVVLTVILDQLWYPRMGGPFSFSGVGAFALGHTPLGWGVLRVGTVGLAVMTTLAAAFAWRWRAGLVLLALYFAVSTGVTYHAGWRARFEVTETQRTLADVVRRIAPARHVIHHNPGSLPYHFHYYNLSYFLPEYDFRPLPASLDDRAGDLVLSGRRLGFGASQFGASGSDARIVALENLGFPGIAYRQALWVLPGPEQTKLAERRWLLPRRFPLPLPREDLASVLRIKGNENGSPATAIDGSVPLDLEVEHRGSVPWVNTSGMRKRTFSVGIDARWNQDGVTRVRHWIPLPRTLFPGEAVSLSARLPAPNTPGRYRLQLAVSQQVNETERQRGNTVVTLDIRVVTTGDALSIDAKPSDARPTDSATNDTVVGDA